MEKYLKDDAKTFLEDKQPQAPVIRTKVNRSSELRDRLRTRLLKHKEKKIEKGKQRTVTNNASVLNNKPAKAKVESRVPIPSNMPPPAVIPGDSTEVVSEMTDITGLVNYIEGNTTASKVELAKKKAEKKARQKEKKEQERLDAELEAKLQARRLEEEAKRKEQERLKEKERQEKLKKQEEKQFKKKLKKQRQLSKKLEEVVETIPAMVTIKRVPNSENGPSVTITLKGYTPDQDKLLYTLVDKPAEIENSSLPKIEEKLVLGSNKSRKKKKKDKENEMAIEKLAEEPNVFRKEVKVTLAVDKNPTMVVPQTTVVASNLKTHKNVYNCCNHSNITQEEEIRTFGNLRLPPGITITKVQSPAPNKKYLGSEAPIKSQQGVIVVETETLAKNNENKETYSKSNKKKKKKKQKKVEATETNSETSTIKMVTLKNPMFQQYTHALNKPEPMPSETTGAASIITNENGMVTIRSSRLQQSLDQGLPASPLGFPIPMPVQEISHVPEKLNSPVREESALVACEPGSVMESEPISEIIKGISRTSINCSLSPKCLSPEPVITKFTNGGDIEQETVDAQQILSGLPGIEITKVDKNAKRDEERIPEEAQVTIIPSSGNQFDFDFGKDDDWIYETVFKPRNVSAEELDDEELELEEFKRFCQQSVPPKCKEKVTLNVADIVLKKKADLKLS